MESVSGTSATGQLGHEAILEATLRCLREEGYDATTIRRIARQLDCAIGSIYRYFTDKRELLLAVTQRLIEPVAIELETGGSFEDSVDRFISLAKSDGEPYRLMYWLSCRSNTQQLPTVVTRIIDAWTQRLGDGSLALQCWAMMHGSIIAGIDSVSIRTAVINMAGHRAAQPSMEQLVSLLKQPMKRPAPVAAAEKAEPTVVVTMTQPAAMPVSAAAEHRAGASDDVCLL